MNHIQNHIKILNLEKSYKNISVIDNIKLFIDFFNSNIFIRSFKKESRLNLVEVSIKNIVCNSLYKTFLFLSQNYYNNFLLDILFILQNPFLYDSEIMRILKSNIDIILQIPMIIDKILNNICISELRLFYNEYLIQRWLDSLDFEIITYDTYNSIVKEKASLKIYSSYVNVYKIFSNVAFEVKNIVKKYSVNYIGLNHIPGCINVSPDYYAYCAKLHTGINIGTDISYTRIYNWAIKEFKKLKKIMRIVSSNINPSYSKYTLKEIIKRMNTNPVYKFSSKEEYILAHRNLMKKYRDLFINRFKFPLLTECNLVDFSNPKLAAGYYYQDAFYINSHEWATANRYETLALILHETIPGHHLQLSYDAHSDKNKSLLLGYVSFITNGFVEGWGLFSEKLCDNSEDISYEDLYGILQFNMLRTLRIIAEIQIHVYGVSPEKLILLFKKYLSMSENNIRAEIYRYVCLPGQALTYKVGCEVINKIFQKKFNRRDFLLNEDALDFYKELITNCIEPLDIIMNKYNCNNDDLFI
jgi:hypothetical protein